MGLAMDRLVRDVHASDHRSTQSGATILAPQGKIGLMNGLLSSMDHALEKGPSHDFRQSDIHCDPGRKGTAF